MAAREKVAVIGLLLTLALLLGWLVPPSPSVIDWAPTGTGLELTRFRGHFRSYSEGVQHVKTPYLPPGVPA